MKTDAVDRTEAPTGTPPANRDAHSTPRPSGGSADSPGIPALSASIAHILVNQSALHAWHAHPRLNPNYRQEESADFDYGRAAHSVLLEGKESSLYVIEANDWRTKAAQEARDKARENGFTPLLTRQMAKVRAMVGAAKDFIAGSELAGIFEDGKPEVSIEWMEGPTRCTMRADWLRTDNRLIVDYKTAASANPDAFLRAAIANGYTMQDAFYRRGVLHTAGHEPAFAFLVQEKEPPFICSLVAFDPAMEEMGDRHAQYALALWQNCMASGEWRGYPNRIAYLSPPAWYAAQAEELTDNEVLDRSQA